MPPGGCESSSFCASSLFSCGNAPTETTIHYREPPPQIGRSFFFKAWSWPPFFLFIIVSFGGRSGNSSISRHQSTNEADGIRGFSSFRSSFPLARPTFSVRHKERFLKSIEKTWSSTEVELVAANRLPKSWESDRRVFARPSSRFTQLNQS